ncbi:alpha/beta fold hydrolase [Rhodohalobacter sp. SW132]|uniref:alpha/beta fold hydrolase n=1 Tax=Rhodohalobacter sp. SW132 TaxID=2293433 RepID=UPI000E24B1FD|nr:alpha/beta fold hydrolase [Rhodohalobacter sp. SW132]REL29195.1 alpha/beta fold hydrolase [Rhodohalobacter sp. SW132]
MKFFTLFVSIVICSVSGLFAQANSYLDGNWEGVIDFSGERMSFSVIFNTIYEETDGAINIPQHASYELPVEVPYLTADSLVFTFQTGSGAAEFRASFTESSPDFISGTYLHGGSEYPFTLSKELSGPDSPIGDHTEQEITIPFDTHEITGSLVTPNSFNDSTLIILATGSGDQTRDNTIGGFDLFRELAIQFADRGFFTFRYDERGTGSSTGVQDASIPELAEDLKGVATFFSGDTAENSFSTTIYLGHNQGGVVALLAARELAPQKLVLMATPILPGDEVITAQIERIAELQEIPDDVVEQNLEFQNKVFQAVRSGDGWSELEEDIAGRLRDQIEELPEAQQRTLGDMESFIDSQVNRQLEGAKSRWFKSFIETDPRDALSELEISMLAIFAENDAQVISEKNIAELEPYSEFLEYVIIPDTNHLFQVSESGLPGEYQMLDRSFSDRFLMGLFQFLNQKTD